MYSVRLIPPDLRHEETIIQAANALDCLQKTINSVFERIDARIARNSAKAQQLSERIQQAQSKVRGLVGTKKAIKIFAPARFPASHVFNDLPLTFQAGAGSEMVEQQQQYEVQSSAGMTAPTTTPPHEKLVFFHVASKQLTAPSRPNQTPRPSGGGLGDVPPDLRSVSSLLRFNSDEMIYGVDSADCDLNSWKRARLFKHQRKVNGPQLLKQQQLLEPAPHSLAHRNQKQAPTPSGGLRYTPRLHEAPEIDLPLDLPDLPGIADDLQFEGKAQQQIAPSLYIDNLPELPELQQEATETEQTRITNENIPKMPAAESSAHSKEKHKTETKSLPPPPPPPPPSIMAPPPPPPPPPAALVVASNTKGASVAAAPAAANSRSELMDAIRQAGGALGGRLRASPAAAPLDAVDAITTPTPNTKTAKGGGDLMADLHNKLLMRRKGISGAKENQNNNGAGALSASGSGNPVYSRLSALIPPPPASATRRRHSDEDDDAEDDGDWAD